MKNEIVPYCRGVCPLTPRLAPWMVNLLFDEQRVVDLVQANGSPVHLHHPQQMRDNIDELAIVARARSVDMQIFFAHKANKCIQYARQAAKAGIGIDVSSQAELAAAVKVGFSGPQITLTAAVKNDQTIHAAVEAGATIVVDSHNDWNRIATYVHLYSNKDVNLAIRATEFVLPGAVRASRFGTDLSEIANFVAWGMSEHRHVADQLSVVGLHFHLDGGTAEDRIAALDQSVKVAVNLRKDSHPIEFIDIGGGFPVQYLAYEHHWAEFHEQLDRQLRGEDVPPVVVPGHPYGRTRVGDSYQQTQRNYPTWQDNDAVGFLEKILDGRGIAKLLKKHSLRLHCQPGRALVNDCGMTAARVMSIKLGPELKWWITLEMNQTHCKTTSVDFAVDPILLPTARRRTKMAMKGFLVGTYCAEDDYLTPRLLEFPHSINVGDTIVFPNTAAYQMHFMESQGHQFDLPKNLMV